VAAAEAAGYIRIGPYFPGLGAHFGKVSNIDLTGTSGFGDEQIANPFTILYDGTQPTSRVAGFMYVSTAEEAPERRSQRRLALPPEPLPDSLTGLDRPDRAAVRAR
jgi:hypothetical protein